MNNKQESNQIQSPPTETAQTPTLSTPEILVQENPNTIHTNRSDNTFFITTPTCLFESPPSIRRTLSTSSRSISTCSRSISSTCTRTTRKKQFVRRRSDRFLRRSDRLRTRSHTTKEFGLLLSSHQDQDQDQHRHLRHPRMKRNRNLCNIARKLGWIGSNSRFGFEFRISSCSRVLKFEWGTWTEYNIEYVPVVHEH